VLLVASSHFSTETRPSIPFQSTPTMETLVAPIHQHQPHDALKSSCSAEARSLTPVAGLALLRRLSQELQTAQSDAEPTTDKSLDHELIAALYVQRAATLLEYADYDASVSLPLDALACPIDASDQSLTQQQAEADERRAQIMVHAVQQALEDATKALQLAPHRVEGYFLSAQCFRSSGMTEDAGRMITEAVDMLPGNAQIVQLAKEIAVERATKEQATLTRFPVIITTPEAIAASIDSDLSHLAITDAPEETHEGDNNDEGDGSSVRATWQRIATEFETLRVISESPQLARLEDMMHSNVHHQCACSGDARHLEHALKTVISFLLLIIRSCRVLGFAIDSQSLEDMIKAKLERADWYHFVIQDRAVRKWIVQTLVPVTRSTPVSLESEPSIGVKLLRDGLVLLTRVLLAVGGWRRCTAMPHALGYAELSHDLAKELSSSFSSCSSSSSSVIQGLTRLEMACSDVFGVALRDLLSDFGEALALHQDSLETAVLTKDRAYELRCHHLIGQALLRMKEPVLAQAEFMQLLVQSQEEANAAMESLARFELGESCVQRGELDDALIHFKYARTICNQTGSCSGMWRMQSVHRAIDFYAALRPAKRRDAVMCASSLMLKNMENGGLQLPTRRPGGLFSESTFHDAMKHDEPQQDREWHEIKASSVVSKLFASEGSQPTASDSVKPAPVKPRRRGGWRDSVFSVPSSAMSRAAQLSSCSSSRSSSSSSSQFSCSPSSTTSSDAKSTANSFATTSSIASASSLSAVMNYTGKLAAADGDDDAGSHQVVSDPSSEEENGLGTRHASL